VFVTLGLLVEFVLTGQNPAVASVFDHSLTVADALFLGAVAASGYPVVRSGYYSANNLSLDIDLLMGTAIIAATAVGYFVEAARTVGLTRDGAVIISTDRTIQKQMVRIKSQNDMDTEAASATVNYADWMGTKHLSVIEVSVREEVVAAITLGEENSRMSLFEDGDYDDYQRDELGGVWRPAG
jgi:hypothetical protein